MKLAKRSLYGLVMSLPLILAFPTYAQPGNLSGSKLENDVSVSDVDIVHGMLSAQFDGRNLSLRVIKDIAKDPIITFGTVRDANGKEVQGEVWLLVAKNDKFIYFHLTDEPNPATDSTTYGGYTVKVKAISTAQFYYHGFGGAVPIIGNETDGFLVTTTKMMVNSAFTEGERQQKSFSTGAVTDYLVHVYDVVQSDSLPPALSAGRWAMIRYLAPDGTELTERMRCTPLLRRLLRLRMTVLLPGTPPRIISVNLCQVRKTRCLPSPWAQASLQLLAWEFHSASRAMLPEQRSPSLS